MKKIITTLLLALSTLSFANAQTNLKQGGTGWDSSTVGQLLVGTSSTLRYSRFNPGAAGTVLQASSTSPFRMEWVATSSLGFPVGGSGTVTSVSLTAPTGLTAASTTCTTTCILALTYASGYAGYQVASGTRWDAFYNASNTLVTLSYASSTYAKLSENNLFTALNSYNATSTLFSLVTGLVRASSSAGIIFQSNNGTQVADFGAGGGSNATFNGGVTITGQTSLSTASTTAVTIPTLYSTTIAYLKGLVADSTNATGTTNQILASTGTSTLWVSTSSLGLAPTSAITGTIGRVARWVTTTTLGNGALYDNGTVAGVNATSSTVAFNVQGLSSLTSIFNVASSTGTSIFQIFSNGQALYGTTTTSTHGLSVGTTTQFTAGVVSRVVGYTWAASTTININTTDIATSTLTATTTLVSPSGTKYDGQMLQYAAVSTSSKTLYLDSGFGTTTGYTSPITVASGTTYYLFQYNQFRGKWDYLSAAGPYN